MQKILYGVTFFVLGLCLGCDKQPKVCFQSTCVAVELAQLPSELERGLQYRESLAKNAGMLFIFSDNVEAAFWMKNTLIPLDMIWIDQDQKIVHVEKNAAPCLQAECPTYGGQKTARYVLEVNAGFADANNLNVGDRATFSLIDRK